MRDLPHAASEPSRKLRRHQLTESGGRKLLLQGVERGLSPLRSEPSKRSHRLTCWSMRHGELPARCMAKLDDLLAEAHLPGAARRQIDRPNWHLCREPKTVGGGRTAQDDHLAALGGDRLDRLLHRWCSGAQPAHDRQEVNTTSGSDQLPPLGQARQGLVHRGAIAKVKQALSRDWRALWQPRRMLKNLLGQALHGRCLSETYSLF
jgi:hypothetical protein